MVSCAVQKFLSLIRSHLFNFCSYFLYFRRQTPKIIAMIYAKSVLPVFSARNFIVSCLTFRSLIHFEGIFICLIFVYGVRESSNFITLHVSVQFSQHHLLKRLSFLQCIFFPPLSWINWLKVCGFISGLPILFHWSKNLFLIAPLFTWKLEKAEFAQQENHIRRKIIHQESSQVLEYFCFPFPLFLGFYLLSLRLAF